MFLMETRVIKDKGKQIWVKCGFIDGWEVPRVGFGGGLFCLLGCLEKALKLCLT